MADRPRATTTGGRPLDVDIRDYLREVGSRPVAGDPTSVPGVARQQSPGAVGGFTAVLPRATYAEMVGLLGPPNAPVDGRKTTAEWALLHRGGRISVYDHKATSRYRPGLPTVDQLRERPYAWHVQIDGSREAAAGAELVRAAIRGLSRSRGRP